MRDIETELMPISTVSEKDAGKFIEWMVEQRRTTDFDKSVIGYPRTCMAVVKRQDDTRAMVPVHPVLMLESLARDPNATDSELVLALSSINDKMQEVMKDSGMAEAFFQTNNERFVYICERHGWKAILYDAEKKEWLLKKRANIDWAALLEKHDANNDQPDAGHADAEAPAPANV